MTAWPLHGVPQTQAEAALDGLIAGFGWLFNLVASLHTCFYVQVRLQVPMDPTYEMKRSVQAEGLDGGTGHYRAGSPERPSKLGRPSPDRPPVEAQALSTPIAKERRSSGELSEAGDFWQFLLPAFCGC